MDTQQGAESSQFFLTAAQLSVMQEVLEEMRGMLPDLHDRALPDQHRRLAVTYLGLAEIAGQPSLFPAEPAQGQRSKSKKRRERCRRIGLILAAAPPPS